MNLISRFIRDDQGQDLIEYALLGAFVSLAAIIGAGILGTGLNNWYTDLGNMIDGLVVPAAPGA